MKKILLTGVFVHVFVFALYCHADPSKICHNVENLVKHGADQYVTEKMDYETIKKRLYLFHKECKCRSIRRRYSSFFNGFSEFMGDKKSANRVQPKGYKKKSHRGRILPTIAQAKTTAEKKTLLIRRYGFVIRYIKSQYNMNLQELRRKEKELIRFNRYNSPDYRCPWHVTMLGQKGSPVAQYALGFGAIGMSYTDSDCPSYLRWLAFAAESGGYVPAIRVMGCAYANANTTEGFEKAIHIFQEGFRRGDVNCAWHLGDVAVRARLYDIAVKWFTIGADRNHEGCTERAAAIYGGEYGMKYVNIRKAIYYYERCIQFEQRKNSMFNSIPLYQNKIRALRAKL